MPEPPARRNHVAGMLNDHMIVYSGIDNYQKNLNDIVSIDLTRGKWTTLYAGSSNDGQTREQTIIAEQNIPALSRAKACMVIHSQRAQQDIPSLDEIPFVKWKKAEDLLKFEGMYIFGGLHDDSSINNKLYILCLQNEYQNQNRMRFRWKSEDELDFEGIPPKGRYDHGM